MTAEKTILDPLNSATSKGADLTMVSQEPEGMDPKEQKYDFFFYGTLLVPSILVRVLGHDCANLTFQDAALRDYTRHHVKNADYPAVINRYQTAALVPQDRVLFPEDFLTRGTLVRGLSYTDLSALDIFEGTQYSRIKCKIQVLSEPSGVQSLPKHLSDPSKRTSLDAEKAEEAAKKLQEETKGQDVPGQVTAWVYVWGEDLSGLEPDIWSFEQFLRDKAHVWTGMHTTEYDEVEQHRALATLPDAPQGKPALSPDATGMDGEEAKVLGRTMKGYPDFGHGMSKYWKFNKELVNLNHGSYGSPPIPVIEAMRKLSDEIESFPDLFMRRSWLAKLNDVRSQVAGIIGANQDEVVIVPNATHGVNNIVTQINWQEGDVIVIFNITYGAVAQTMKHLCDRNPGLSIETIELTFPCSHAEILRKTEEVIKKYNEEATPSYTGESKPTGRTAHSRIRMMVLDSIASNPGVIYPWTQLVKLCKRYGILSLVDGAHSIGQHKVNLGEVDCDFFVSNCHKWLMSHRGGALLYVPLRNQHLIRSTFPTSAGYESTRYPTQGVDRPWSFTRQYEWTGTLDWTPWLTIVDAIKFRESIGGEDRIMKYNHTLAVQGGRRLRKLWGTDIMENVQAEDGELTAAMVNVALPGVPEPKDLEERFKQQKYFEDQMFEAKTFAAVYWHGGRWWCRFSAQVWNELSDFDFVGEVFNKICEGIRQGKHLPREVEKTEILHDKEDLPVADE